MTVSEILKTCSHEKVAGAAVASIGGDFVRRVNGVADRTGVAPGAFVARTVREFGRHAGERRISEVERAVKKADMPILQGLRYIVEEALEKPER